MKKKVWIKLNALFDLTDLYLESFNTSLNLHVWINFLKQNTNPKTLLIWQYFHPKLFQVDLNPNFFFFLPLYRCSGILLTYWETTCCWNEKWNIMSSVPLTLMKTLRTVMCTWTESVHKGRTGKMWFSPSKKPGWHRHRAFVGRQVFSYLTFSCRSWPSAADICWAKENSFKNHYFEIAWGCKV